MGWLVIFSLVVKVVGAALEIGAQSLVSQLWSVDTYGTYSFFVSIAELFFNALFAGIIKFNNYYIPADYEVRGFKKRFYGWFAIPVCSVAIIVAVVLQQLWWVLVFMAGFAYLIAMDSSSTLMSNRKYKTALIGEYALGRLILLVAFLAIYMMNHDNINFLYIGYIAQFAFVFIFFLPTLKRIEPNTIATKKLDRKSAIGKYLVYQSTEISHTIVTQTSVIVQYIFGGAYRTALVSIIMIVRRLINFISGPTSKLYQPEFSKRYASGDKKALADTYAQITRLQLCFMMPVFVFLIASPQSLLRVFNKELVEYGFLVRFSALVFLYMIAFGPQSNFLSMTGNEKSDTISNWVSIAVQYSLMYLFKDNEYFVVIGFCGQIIFCTTYKLICHLRFMRIFPMPVRDYFKLVAISGAAIFLIHSLPGNIAIVAAMCLIVFVMNFAVVLPANEKKEMLDKIARRHARG